MRFLMVFAILVAVSNVSAYDEAIAVLHPTEGNDVYGIVRFEKVSDGIRVFATVRGLSRGKHGFHIHEFGDCSVADASSAGGHFNPYDMPHGKPTDEKRHVGDLGNIEASMAGYALADFVDSVISFEGEASIIGKAVIVHEDTDEFTQSSGSARPRVACGVIGIKQQV